MHVLSKVQLAYTTPGHRTLRVEEWAPPKSNGFCLKIKVSRCFVVLGNLCAVAFFCGSMKPMHWTELVA